MMMCYRLLETRRRRKVAHIIDPCSKSAEGVYDRRIRSPATPEWVYSDSRGMSAWIWGEWQMIFFN
jgi:hypothetical protein